MPRKGQKIYVKYKESDLERAADAVKSKGTSFGKASNMFNVPKTTIFDHVTGKIKKRSKTRRKNSFSD
jgi:transposase